MWQEVIRPRKGRAETCNRNEQCDSHKVIKIVFYVPHGLSMTQIMVVTSQRNSHS